MKNCRQQLLILQFFLYSAPTIQKSWIRPWWWDEKLII